MNLPLPIVFAVSTYLCYEFIHWYGKFYEYILYMYKGLKFQK